MNFKDAFEDDLEYAYFDLDEFADKHLIDGRECIAVVTDVTDADSKMSYGLMKATLNPKETAITKASYIIYVRDIYIRRKITAGARIDFDQKPYFVQDVKHTRGVYRITIGIHAV